MRGRQGDIDLVKAAAEQISLQGLAGASARVISRAASVSASAINYHFSSIERLFTEAFMHGAVETAAWLACMREDLDRLPKSPHAFSIALEEVILAWTQQARPLALLYQEALAEGDSFQSQQAQWTGLFRGFWAEVAKDLGCPPQAAALAHAMFEMEALFGLSTWAPTLERAALRELIAHFAEHWLDEPAGRCVGAYEQAQQYLQGTTSLWGATTLAAEIAAVAAAIVEQEGLAKLTHRAVALKMGATLGAVTYHFPTIDRLVTGAVHGQVVNNMSLSRATFLDVRHPRPELARRMRLDAARQQLKDVLTARRNMFLAAIRKDQLVPAAAAIRFSFGPTMHKLLSASAPELAKDPLHGACLARLGCGAWIVSSVEADQEAARDRIYDAMVTPLLREPVA